MRIVPRPLKTYQPTKVIWPPFQLGENPLEHKKKNEELPRLKQPVLQCHRFAPNKREGFQSSTVEGCVYLRCLTSISPMPSPTHVTSYFCCFLQQKLWSSWQGVLHHRYMMWHKIMLDVEFRRCQKHCHGQFDRSYQLLDGAKKNWNQTASSLQDKHIWAEIKTW